MFKRFKNWIISLIIGTAIVAGGYGYLGGDKIPAEHKLKCDKSRILHSRDIDIKDKEKVKSYLYATNKKVAKLKDEDITKRTKNAQFIKKEKRDGKQEWTANIYTGEPFYKDGQDWVQTETATTTINAFDKQVKVSWLDNLFGKQAFALSTTTYSGAGDGTVYDYQHITWDAVHDSATGDSAAPTNTSHVIRSMHVVGMGPVGFGVDRSFLPFDTSSLPDNANISAALLKLYVHNTVNNDNDGDDFVRIVQTDQPSNTTLTAADFNNCGATDNPTAGAGDLDITNLTTSAYNTWTLNSTGRGWISKTGYTKLGAREGHDVLDHAIASAGTVYSEVGIRYSEYAGTTYDPKLEITYTTGGNSYTIKSGVNYANATERNNGRKIARTSNGDLHVVWTDYRNSNYHQIYYASSTDDGTTWTEEAMTSANYDQYNPSIAVDSNNNLHLAWYGKHSGSATYSQLRYRKFTTSWQSIENLTSENYHQYTPTIAIDSSNNIHIAWSGRYLGVNQDQIRYRKYSEGGWQAIVNITTETDNTQCDPAIAIDSNNYIHLTFNGFYTGNAYRQIRYRKYTDSWQTIVNLTTANYPSDDSSIAIDSNNYVHIAFYGKHAGSTGVKQIRYRKYTNSWQAIENLTTEADYSQYDPSIAIDSHNYIHIVWNGGITSYTSQIRYRKYTDSWQAIVNLTNSNDYQFHSGLIWALQPTVSSAKTNRPKDGYAFVWTDCTSTDSVKYFESTDLDWDTASGADRRIIIVD